MVNDKYWLSTFPKAALFRSHATDVFLRKGVLKLCRKFTGEHPCRKVISIKFQSNFIEIALRHGCSAVNLLHFFRTPFLKNTSGWLLLSFLWFNKWNKKSKPKLAKESIMRIILDSQFSPGNIIFIRLASTQNLAQLNQPFSPRYVNFFSLSFSVCHQASALAINLTVHDYFITFQTSNIIFWWYFHCDKKQV